MQHCPESDCMEAEGGGVIGLSMASLATKNLCDAIRRALKENGK